MPEVARTRRSLTVRAGRRHARLCGTGKAARWIQSRPLRGIARGGEPWVCRPRARSSSWGAGPSAWAWPTAWRVRQERHPARGAWPQRVRAQPRAPLVTPRVLTPRSRGNTPVRSDSRAAVSRPRPLRLAPGAAGTAGPRRADKCAHERGRRHRYHRRERSPPPPARRAPRRLGRAHRHRAHRGGRDRGAPVRGLAVVRRGGSAHGVLEAAAHRPRTALAFARRLLRHRLRQHRDRPPPGAQVPARGGRGRHRGGARGGARWVGRVGLLVALLGALIAGLLGQRHLAAVRARR